MGGLEQRKEEIRDARGIHWLTDFADDVRYAVRSLRRAPALAVFVVVTISLGIGMTAMPFSMLDTLILRPYPVAHPRDVVTLVSTSRDSAFESFSYREYLDIRGHTKSYDGVVANAPVAAAGFSAEPRATPLVRSGMLVSGNYFRVLGVAPQAGRGFRDDEDDVPGRDAVAVLAADFWKRDLGADPSVVGRTILLNGTRFTVVGIAPDDFPGMQIFVRPDFYLPLAMARMFSTNPQKKFFVDRDDRELTVRARLKPGTSLRHAGNELAVLARNFEREYPEVNKDRGAAVRTQFEMRTQDNDFSWKMGVIGAVMGLAVLLVACTNAAGLLLARARTRTREISVRLAIGAGRFRLIRLLLTESLVLATLGGLGGIAVGYGGIRLMGTVTNPADLPVLPFRMDTRVLLACLALSVVSAVLCGLAPALQSTRTDLVNGLKAADANEPGGGGGRKSPWGRNVLVVAQVAMSLMLLAGSFLMFRGFQRILIGGVGFAKDHLLMVKFDPRLLQYDEAQTSRFYERLAERARQVHGVESAAFTRNPPFSADGFGRLAFVPEGFQMPRDRQTFTSTMDIIDEGFFETLKIPILRGRGFRASDTADAPRVAVVNEYFAKHYWPDANVLGKRIRLDGAGGLPVEIVGVAQTTTYRDSFDKPMDFVYMPLRQRAASKMILLLRSRGDPLQFVQPVRNVVRALDSNMPVLETRSYEDLYRYGAVDGPRVAVELVGAMGAAGLLLAVAGLYGLVAYNVSRRTREIGIRIAVGAAPFDVIRLMMSKGLVLVGVGTAIGLAMGLVLERLMNSMLFNAGGVDLTVHLVVVPALVLVTMLAAYVPARRASRIAPTVALRYE